MIDAQGQSVLVGCTAATMAQAQNIAPREDSQEASREASLKVSHKVSLAQAQAYGLMEQAAIVIEGGQIIWVGAQADLPGDYHGFESHDLKGRLVTPAFIDCHTHSVYGGSRAREFEMRLEGASYADIAASGGGILSTMKATRAASEEELVADALSRIDAMIAEGVTSVEIKSGYGLTIEDELKMLRAARSIGELRPLRIKTSYLAAHALPPEYKARHEDYIREVAIPGLQQAHEQNLVDAVDGFCETIAFSPEQLAPLFAAARAMGLPVKLHAEQLSDLGGAQFAAKYDAVSADHLEYLGEEGIAAMARANMVAVLLPGAFYTLRETQMPPIEGLREAGVPLAIATDCNPGSSPLSSLLLTMNMACTLFRLTPQEALAGVTCCAARALGLEDCGRIEAGKRADLAVWNAAHPAELSYRIGFNALFERVYGGQDAIG